MHPIQFSDHEPEWVESNHCFKCNLRFTLMKRPSHCRSCGRIFCKAHCSHMMTLPHQSLQGLHKCCDDCFQRSHCLEEALYTPKSHFHISYADIITGNLESSPSLLYDNIYDTQRFQSGHTPLTLNPLFNRKFFETDTIDEDESYLAVNHQLIQDTSVQESYSSNPPSPTTHPSPPPPPPPSLLSPTAATTPSTTPTSKQLGSDELLSSNRSADPAPLEVEDMVDASFFDQQVGMAPSSSTSKKQRPIFTRGSVCLPSGHVIDTARYFDTFVSALSTSAPHDPNAKGKTEGGDYDAMPGTTTRSSSSARSPWMSPSTSSTPSPTPSPVSSTRPLRVSQHVPNTQEDSSHVRTSTATVVPPSTVSSLDNISSAAAYTRTHSSSQHAPSVDPSIYPVEMKQGGFYDMVNEDLLITSENQTISSDSLSLSTPELIGQSSSSSSSPPPPPPSTQLSGSASPAISGGLLPPRLAAESSSAGSYGYRKPQELLMVMQSLWLAEHNASRNALSNALTLSNHFSKRTSILGSQPPPAQGNTSATSPGIQPVSSPNVLIPSDTTSSSHDQPSSLGPHGVQSNSFTDTTNLNLYNPSNHNQHPFRINAEPTVAYLLRLLLTPFSLTPTHHEFRTIFLLIHKSFISSPTLVLILIAFYNQPPLSYPNDREYFNAKLTTIYIVILWLQLHYEDVRYIEPFIRHVTASASRDDIIFKQLIARMTLSSSVNDEVLLLVTQLKLMQTQITNARTLLSTMYNNTHSIESARRAQVYINTISNSIAVYSNYVKHNGIFRQFTNISSLNLLKTLSSSSHHAHMDVIFHNNQIPTSLSPLIATPLFADVINPPTRNNQGFTPITVSLLSHNPHTLATVLTQRHGALFSMVRLRDGLDKAWIRHPQLIASLAESVLGVAWDTIANNPLELPTLDVKSRLHHQPTSSTSDTSVKDCDTTHDFVPFFNSLLTLIEAYNRVTLWVTSVVLQSGLRTAVHDEYSRYIQYQSQCKIFELLYPALLIDDEHDHHGFQDPIDEQHISSNDTIPRTRHGLSLLVGDILTSSNVDYPISHAELSSYARSRGIILDNTERRVLIRHINTMNGLHLDSLESLQDLRYSLEQSELSPNNPHPQHHFNDNGEDVFRSPSTIPSIYDHTTDTSMAGPGSVPARSIGAQFHESPLEKSISSPEGQYASIRGMTTSSQSPHLPSLTLANSYNDPSRKPDYAPPQFSGTAYSFTMRARQHSNLSIDLTTNTSDAIAQRLSFSQRSSSSSDRGRVTFASTVSTPTPPAEDLQTETLDSSMFFDYSSRRRTNSIISTTPIPPTVSSGAINPRDLMMIGKFNSYRVRPRNGAPLQDDEQSNIHTPPPLSHVPSATGASTTSTPMDQQVPPVVTSSQHQSAYMKQLSSHTPSKIESSSLAMRTPMKPGTPGFTPTPTPMNTPAAPAQQDRQGAAIPSSESTQVLNTSSIMIHCSDACKHSIGVFLQICDYLLKTSDFFTLGAIVSGLQHSTVQQLPSWTQVMSENTQYQTTWTTCKAVVDNGSNYGLYRLAWGKGVSEYLSTVNHEPILDNFLAKNHGSSDNNPHSGIGVPSSSAPHSHSTSSGGGIGTDSSNTTTTGGPGKHIQANSTLVSGSQSSEKARRASLLQDYQNIVKNLARGFYWNKVPITTDPHTSPKIRFNQQLLNPHITSQQQQQQSNGVMLLLSQHPVILSRKIVDIGIRNTVDGLGLSQHVDYAIQIMPHMMHLPRLGNSQSHRTLIATFLMYVDYFQRNEYSLVSQREKKKQAAISNHASQAGSTAISSKPIENSPKPSAFSRTLSAFTSKMLVSRSSKQLAPFTPNANATSSPSQPGMDKQRSRRGKYSQHRLVKKAATPMFAPPFVPLYRQSKIPVCHPLPLLPCIMKDLFVLQDNMKLFVTVESSLSMIEGANSAHRSGPSGHTQNQGPTQGIDANQLKHPSKPAQEQTPIDIIPILDACLPTLESYFSSVNPVPLVTTNPLAITTGPLPPPPPPPPPPHSPSMVNIHPSPENQPQSPPPPPPPISPLGAYSTPKPPMPAGRTHRASILDPSSFFTPKSKQPAAVPPIAPHAPQPTPVVAFASTPGSLPPTIPQSAGAQGTNAGSPPTSIPRYYSSLGVPGCSIQSPYGTSSYIYPNDHPLHEITTLLSTQLQRRVSWQRIQQQWITLQPLCVAIHAAYTHNIALPQCPEITDLSVFVNDDTSYRVRSEEESILPSSFQINIHNCQQKDDQENSDMSSSTSFSLDLRKSAKDMNSVGSDGKPTKPLFSDATFVDDGTDHSKQYTHALKFNTKILGTTGPGDLSQVMFVFHNPHLLKRRQQRNAVSMLLQSPPSGPDPSTSRTSTQQLLSNIQYYQLESQSLSSQIQKTSIFNEILHHQQQATQLPLPFAVQKENTPGVGHDDSINIFKTIPLPPFPTPQMPTPLSTRVIQTIIAEMLSPPHVVRYLLNDPDVELKSEEALDQLDRAKKRSYISKLSTQTILTLFPGLVKLPWAQFNAQQRLMRPTQFSECLAIFYSNTGHIVGQPQPYVPDLVLNGCVVPYSLLRIIFALRKFKQKILLKTSDTTLSSYDDYHQQQQLQQLSQQFPTLRHNIELQQTQRPGSSSSASGQSTEVVPINISLYNLQDITITPEFSSKLKEVLSIPFYGYTHPDYDLYFQYAALQHIPKTSPLTPFTENDPLSTAQPTHHQPPPQQSSHKTAQPNGLSDHTTTPALQSVSSRNTPCHAQIPPQHPYTYPIAFYPHPVSLLLSELMLIIPPDFHKTLFDQLPPLFVSRWCHLAVWDSIEHETHDDDWFWDIVPGISPMDGNDAEKASKQLIPPREQLIQAALVAEIHSNPQIEEDYGLKGIENQLILQALRTGTTKVFETTS